MNFQVYITTSKSQTLIIASWFLFPPNSMKARWNDLHVSATCQKVKPAGRVNLTSDSGRTLKKNHLLNNKVSLSKKTFCAGNLQGGSRG